MKRCVRLAAIVLSIGVLFIASAPRAADELKPRQATQAEVGRKALCPVMNVTFEVAKNTQVIDYKGKSFFFCCDHCVADFTKNPDAFAQAGQLRTREATAAEVGKQVTCQVMGTKFEVARHTPVIDYKGKSYYFCCENCVQEFQKNPDKFAMK
jgi:YHS domain-containing protein